MDDLQQWWEVPSIGQFVSLFRFAFNLPEIDIEELEVNLAADDCIQGNVFVKNLVISLLQGLYPRRSVTLLNWETYLERILERKWVRSDKRKNPLSETVGFFQLKLRTRVEIIYCLCLYRLDCDDVAKAMKSMDAEALRVQSLGTDDQGNVYWYFYGTRLYKEEPSLKTKREWKEYIGTNPSKTLPLKRGRGRPRKNVPIKSDGESDSSDGNNGEKNYLTLDSKSRWSVVCTTLDEWKSFVNQFRGSKSKNEIALFQIISQNFLPVLNEMYEKKGEQVRALLKASPKSSSPQVGIRKRKCPNVNTTPKRTDKSKKRKTSVDHIDHLERKTKEIEEENFMNQNRRDDLKADDGKIVSSTSSPPSIYMNDRNLSYEPELMFKLRTVLSTVKVHKDAWPFLLPVSEALAPDYYQIVKDPIDLSAIERKVELKVYNSIWQIESDFQKLVSNCRLYNGEDSAYTSMAKTVWRVFRKGIAQLLNVSNSTNQSNENKVESSQKDEKIIKKTLKKSKTASRKKKNTKLQTIEGLNMLADASEQALKEVGITEGELYIDGIPDISSKSKSFPDLKVVTIQNHPPSFIAKWKRSSNSRDSFTSDSNSGVISPISSLKEGMSPASDNSMEALSPAPNLNLSVSSLDYDSSRDVPSPSSANSRGTSSPSVASHHLSSDNSRDSSSILSNSRNTSPIRNNSRVSSPIPNNSRVSSPIPNNSRVSSPIPNNSRDTSPVSDNSRNITSPVSLQSRDSTSHSLINSADDMSYASIELRDESFVSTKLVDNASPNSLSSRDDASLGSVRSRDNASPGSVRSRDNASPGSVEYRNNVSLSSARSRENVSPSSVISRDTVSPASLCSRNDASPASLSSGDDMLSTTSYFENVSSRVLIRDDNDMKDGTLNDHRKHSINTLSTNSKTYSTSEHEIKQNEGCSNSKINGYPVVDVDDEVSNKISVSEKPISPDSRSTLIVRGSSPLSDGNSSQGSSKSLQELTDNYHVLDLPVDISKVDGLCNVNISSLLYKIIKENHVLSSSDNSDVETPSDHLGPHENLVTDIDPTDSLGPPILEASVEDIRANKVTELKSSSFSSSSSALPSPPQLGTPHDFLGLSPINDIRTVDASAIGISTTDNKRCIPSKITFQNTSSFNISNAEDSNLSVNESREEMVTPEPPVLSYALESNSENSLITKEPELDKEQSITYDSNSVNNKTAPIKQSLSDNSSSSPVLCAKNSVQSLSNSVEVPNSFKEASITNVSRPYPEFIITRLHENQVNVPVTSQLPLQLPTTMPFPQYSPRHSSSQVISGSSMCVTPTSNSVMEATENHLNPQIDFNTSSTQMTSISNIANNSSIPLKQVLTCTKNVELKKDNSPRQIKKRKRSIAITHNQQCGNLTSSTNITAKTIYASLSPSETKSPTQEFIPAENTAMFKLTNLVSNTQSRFSENTKDLRFPLNVTSSTDSNSKVNPSSVFVPYTSSNRLDVNQPNIWNEKDKLSNYLPAFSMSNPFYSFPPTNYVNSTSSFNSSGNFSVINSRPQTYINGTTSNQPIIFNSSASDNMKTNSLPMMGNIFTPMPSIHGLNSNPQQLDSRTFSPENQKDLQAMSSQKLSDGFFQAYGIQGAPMIHDVSAQQRLSQSFVNISPPSYILPVQPSGMMAPSLLSNVIVNSANTNSTNIGEIRPQFSVNRTMPLYTILPSMPPKLIQ